MLDSIVGKFGFKGAQAEAFKVLLELTGCVKNFQQNFENHLAALDYLVKITQENWIRKAGTERWEQDDSES
ncbi:MAG: hypothetical protein REH83_01805, partial [Rickettsiella sp.]|nr:hypothetical protein [Rickettsiella sp.]